VTGTTTGRDTITVDGRRVRFTHPDRVLWPATGTTKRDLVDYLLAIAPALLPHIAGRGLTLGRWPEGIDGKGWLQAECRGRPAWMGFEPSRSRRTGGEFEYCVVDDRPGLAWLAGLGTIELHPFLAPVARRAEPSFVVFDLDPVAPATLVDCARVALRLHGVLAAHGLETFAKTSGMAGLHVYAPLAAGHTFSGSKAFAKSVAAELASRDPIVIERVVPRDARTGRVFVDWVQNDASRSTVAAYSPRAAPVPSVSMPVRWDEVEAAAEGTVRLRFGFFEALERVDRLGDLFAPTLAGRGRLEDAA
jgi:bifunctional non-homologous end joining protein LigD